MFEVNNSSFLCFYNIRNSTYYPGTKCVLHTIIQVTIKKIIGTKFVLHNVITSKIHFQIDYFKFTKLIIKKNVCIII